MISELLQPCLLSVTSFVVFGVRDVNSSMNPCVSISPSLFAFDFYVPLKEQSRIFGILIEIEGNEIGNAREML